MNYTAPVSFQTPFNFPQGYYSSPSPFPQASGPTSAYRLHPSENLRQVPEGLYNKYWANEDEALSYEPIKKMKVPFGYEADFVSSQNKLLSCMQRNETIKANEMTSSINARLLNGANFFDMNQRQMPSQALFLGNDPKDNSLPFNLKALYGYENPQNIRAQMQFNQAAGAREQAMAFPQGFPTNQSQSQLSVEAQLGLLQNLQQQIASSQKAYEQLLINNANPMLQNPMYLNAQALNALKQAQNEQQQQQQQQQQQMAMIQNAQNAQNRHLLEQEAQRRYAELMMAKNLANQNSQFIQTSQKIAEQAELNEFPEIHFDLSSFPDFYLMEGEGFADNEEQKMRAFDDLDEKRTAETSATADEMAMKEFYDSQLLEFQTQIIQQQIASEKRLLENKTIENSPKKNKLTKEADESLLKKRQIVFEEAEKKPVMVRKSPKKSPEAEIKAKKVKVPTIEIQFNQLSTQTLQVPDSISSQTSVSPAKDDQWVSPSEQFEYIKEAEIVMKKTAKPKKEKVRPVQPLEFKQQIPRERKMNKLQSLRAAQDNYIEELKKPYVIQLHVDSTDPDQKVVVTKVGEGYQVRPEVLTVNNTQRRPRPIKSIWNPSSLEEEKLVEFHAKLREIFGQDVKSEEAALKLLRGAGMDVDGIVDIISRNADYFKTMLFPEPKPAKVLRF